MNEALLTWAIVLLAFGSFLIGTQIVRRRRTRLDLRPIKGYQALPLLIDESVESDLPPHFSLGTSGVGQTSTVTALASADVMYYLVRRYSFGRQVPLVTLSDPMTAAIAGDTLRQAYIARDNLDVYRQRLTVAWFPQGERSLAFAAGAAAFAKDREAANHILIGRFGVELAFFAESIQRKNQKLIANSTDLEGQAVAFVMADDVVIGEELFVGGLYLNRPDTIRESSLIAQDVLRWSVIIFGILLGILLNAVE